MATATQVSQAAATQGLDAAARAAGLTPVKTEPFTRVSFVPGLGQYSEVIGAAFGLPVGAVSAPIRQPNGIYVMVVDRRLSSDRAKYEQQRDALHRQRLQQLKQQRVQLFLDDLKRTAKIEDRRKEINATVRRTEA